MKAFLKTLGHIAIGGAAAAVAPQVVGLIPMIPHIDPLAAAALGSMASSFFSAFSKQPHKE